MLSHDVGPTDVVGERRGAEVVEQASPGKVPAPPSVRPMPPPSAAPTGASAEVLAPPVGRVPGLDLARALAIVGMFAVHIGPTSDTSLTGRLYALPHGRASLLFVLVSGVGVSLLARARRSSPIESRTTLLWRAVLLLPAGLALQLLDHGVNVILQVYGVLFVLAALALTVRDRWLLVGTSAAALVGPVVFLIGRMQDPDRFSRAEVTWGDSASSVAHGLVLSGPYPVITWAAPLLFGMWLGRRDLTDRRLQRRLLLTGAVVAAGALVVSTVGERLVGPVDGVGWHELLLATPHSQMPPWLVGGTAAAVAVLGGALVLASWAPRSTRPFVALGQLAFTAYVVHLLALHVWSDVLRSDAVGRSALFTSVGVLVLTLFAWVWRRAARHGPFEVLLRVPPRIVDAIRHRTRHRSARGRS